MRGGAEGDDFGVLRLVDTRSWNFQLGEIVYEEQAELSIAAFLWGPSNYNMIIPFADSFQDPFRSVKSDSIH